VRREEFPLGRCPQPELLTSLYSLLTVIGRSPSVFSMFAGHSA